MKRLAIITTHPVQYYAPFFKLLNQSGKISIKVFYTWGEAGMKRFDPGFGKEIDWDIPLLEGYDYEWVNNTAAKPGSHHYRGIINPTLVKQINLWQPHAVLVYGWAYKSHLKAIRYFKNKVPVYFRGDSTLLDVQKGIKALLKSIRLKWVYRHVDHAFYTGTNNKAYFKKYGLKDEQLSFAPHAVDNDRFAINRAAEANQLRQTLGLSHNAILVLFAGKLQQKKSPEILLDAFLSLDLPNVHLLFVGDGHLEKTLKNKAAGCENIYFMPFQNQSYIPVIYQACNLFCLPSQGPGETWGLAVNEAMASGKAVLISDKCGCAIDLVKKNNGIIFESGNIGDLTLALKTLVINKTVIDEYGLQSKLIIQPWDFVHAALAIENKLLNETIRPD